MLVSYAGNTATIASGQAKSGAVDLGEMTLCAIIMPAAWTAADITFEASTSATGTFRPLKRADGTTTPISAFTIASPAANDHVALNPSDFAGVRFVKVVSSVNQGAERSIVLIGGRL